MDASPVARLVRFKAQSVSHAAHLDVATLLHAIDPAVRRYVPRTRDEIMMSSHAARAQDDALLETTDPTAAPATSSPRHAASKSRLDFFARLDLEGQADRTLACPPGSILPGVPNSPLARTTAHVANVTHRCVGFSTPPQAPYNQLSRVIYERHRMAAAVRESKPRRKWQRQPRQPRRRRQRKRGQPTLRGSKSTGSLGRMPPSPKVRQQQQRELEAQEDFYRDILKMHHTASERSKRAHKNGADSPQRILYNRARMQSRRERRRTQRERWDSDAEASVLAVMLREKAKRLAADRFQAKMPGPGDDR